MCQLMVLCRAEALSHLCALTSALLPKEPAPLVALGAGLQNVFALGELFRLFDAKRAIGLCNSAPRGSTINFIAFPCNEWQWVFCCNRAAVRVPVKVTKLPAPRSRFAVSNFVTKAAWYTYSTLHVHFCGHPRRYFALQQVVKSRYKFC